MNNFRSDPDDLRFNPYKTDAELRRLLPFYELEKEIWEENPWAFFGNLPIDGRKTKLINREFRKLNFYGNVTFHFVYARDEEDAILMKLQGFQSFFKHEMTFREFCETVRI